MAATNTAAPTTTIQDEEEKIRFQMELEFVQLLANSSYLNCKTSLFATHNVRFGTTQVF